MASEAVEGGRGGSLGERPSRRRLVRRAGQAPYDEDERERFFTLGPGDLTFVAGTRSERNRLALALLLTRARAERKLVSDPPTLPAEVVSFVAGQLGLTPDVLAGYRRRPATRSAHVTKVCRELGVRAFATEDEQRLSSFVAEKVAHTGNSAALVDAAEDWLVRERLLRPGGETTIERLVYASRAQAEGRLSGLFDLDRFSVPILLGALTGHQALVVGVGRRAHQRCHRAHGPDDALPVFA